LAHGTGSNLGHAAFPGQAPAGKASTSGAATLFRALDSQWIVLDVIAEDVTAVLAEQNPPDGARLTTPGPGPSPPSYGPGLSPADGNRPAVPRV
jgi:hypothetical protein